MLLHSDMKKLILLLVLTFSNFSVSAEPIDQSIYHSIKGFLLHSTYLKKPDENLNYNIYKAINNYDKEGIKYALTSFDDANFPNDKKIIMRALIRYVVWYSIASDLFDANTVGKTWSRYAQDWKFDVKPFLNSNEDNIFSYASYKFRISYAYRYLLLIEPDKQKLIQNIRSLDLPYELELMKKSLTLNSNFEIPTNFYNRYSQPIPIDFVKGINEGNYIKTFNLNVPAPIFDDEQDCTKPSLSPGNMPILSRQSIVNTILEHREVRDQIGGTCYANLAAEMLDIYRQVVRFESNYANPWYWTSGQFNIPENDLNTMRKTWQGDTSAYFISALYTFQNEGKDEKINDFDGGHTDLSIKSALGFGACPQSSWEMGATNPTKTKQYYQTFDLIRLLKDPDNYNGDTPKEEMIDLLKTFSGLFGAISSFTENRRDTEVFEMIENDPVAAIKQVREKINVELLQKVLLRNTSMMTCGNAAYLRGEEFKLDALKFDLENFDYFPAGNKIIYPRNGYVSELFDRNFKDDYNYHDMINGIQENINSRQFMGVGISVCNQGLIHEVTKQYIVDLDRNYSDTLYMINNYDTNFRYNKYGSKLHNQCGGHTYLLSDMRYDSQLKQCEYKLRNSWGKYSNYNQTLQKSKWLEVTDDGKFDIWVPSHHLYNNLKDMIMIRQSKK